jgi:tRNA(Arg) A34 adenosine deaminase TadA
MNIVHHKELNHRIKVKGGALEEECGMLLKEFFSRKRGKYK